ncbi:hypothetical protein ES708_32026 [subsurface metagenome]
MKIFVSHSLDDKELLVKVEETLKPYGIQLLVAEHYYETTETITKKIEKMITDCDLALILLTEKGFNSAFVQQEIGYISSLKRPHIQLVQHGFEKKITGFNFGKDYISFDPSNPERAIEKFKNKVSSMLIEKAEIKKKHEQLAAQMALKKKQMQIKNEKTGIGILVIFIAFVLIFSD